MIMRRLLLMLLCGFGPLLLSACDGEQDDLRVSSIDGVTSVVAGSAIDLEIRGAGSGRVLIRTAAGDDTVAVALVDGLTTLELGPRFSSLAGLVTVVGQGSDRPVQHEIIVRPGPAVGPLELLVGQQTLGDDTSVTEAVVLVTDAFGNPVTDGEVVQLGGSTADGTVVGATTQTSDGLATFLIELDTTEARLYASSGGAFSPDVTVTRAAGSPESIVLELADETVPPAADGRSVIDVSSGLIVDAAGRQLADGTAVALRVDGVDGIGFFSAIVRDGRIAGSVAVPAEPGLLVIKATIGAVSSDPLGVVVVPAVQSFSASAVGAADGQRLEIGPVRTTSGGLVEDGTPVHVDGEPYVLVDGRLSVTWSGAGVPEVVVLGVLAQNQGVSQ